MTDQGLAAEVAARPVPRQSKMIVTNSISIKAPRSIVWALFTNVERWPRWLPTVSTVRPLTNTSFRVGARYRLKQPFQRPMVWEVSEVVPGRSFTWVARLPKAVLRARHDLEDRKDGTCVTLTFAREPRLPFIVPRVLCEVPVRWALRLENRSLKAACETSAASNQPQAEPEEHSSKFQVSECRKKTPPKISGTEDA